MNQQLILGLTGSYMLNIYGLVKLLVVPITFIETASPNSRRTFSCPSSRYLTVDGNGNKKCARCTVCPKGFQTLTKCSLYNNTVCEPCTSGWYNDVIGGSCKRCTDCTPGEYIRKYCYKKHDTVCRSCPRNMFSKYFNALSCTQCKRCNLYEKTLSQCDVNKDTVCGDCEKGYFRVSSTRSCMACSQCPEQYKHLAVPECRDRLGLHHPNICWPSKSSFSLRNFNGNNPTKVSVTDANKRNGKEDSVGNIPLSFFVIILLVVLCGFVVIIIISVVLGLISHRRPPRTMHTRLRMDTLPMKHEENLMKDRISRSMSRNSQKEYTTLREQESSFITDSYSHGDVCKFGLTSLDTRRDEHDYTSDENLVLEFTGVTYDHKTLEMKYCKDMQKYESSDKRDANIRFDTYPRSKDKPNKLCTICQGTNNRYIPSPTWHTENTFFTI